MNRKKVRVLQFKKEMGKGIIIDGQFQSYSFNLNEVASKDLNKIERGVEVEFTIVDKKFPTTVKDLKILVTKESFAKGKPAMSSDALSYGSKNAHRHRGDIIIKPEPKYMPLDTRKTMAKFGYTEIENYELKLNKFPLVQVDKNKEKFIFYKIDKKNRLEVKSYYHDFSHPLFRELSTRQLKAIQSLGLLIRSLVATPEWRMVIGLGGASVYETSMTLHHIYGIPYIPGSAVKGITRSWIMANCFNKDEKKALEDEGFRLIFGSESNKGRVIFFDAFPLDEPKIEVDVMNPHYSTYYSQGQSPGDYGNPVPVYFITLGKSKLNFVLGIKPKDNEQINNGVFAGSLVIDTAYIWLQKALSEHGIGAKTAVGYGIMRV